MKQTNNRIGASTGWRTLAPGLGFSEHDRQSRPLQSLDETDRANVWSGFITENSAAAWTRFPRSAATTSVACLSRLGLIRKCVTTHAGKLFPGGNAGLSAALAVAVVSTRNRRGHRGVRLSSSKGGLVKRQIQAAMFLTTCSVVSIAGPVRAEEPTPVESSTEAPSPGRLRELVKAKQDADKEYATATQESWWAQWMSQGGSIATGAGSAFLLAFWLIPDTNENVTARLGTAVMGGCCTVCGITATLGGSLIQNQSYHVEEKRQASLRAQAAVNEEAQKY